MVTQVFACRQAMKAGLQRASVSSIAIEKQLALRGGGSMELHVWAQTCYPQLWVRSLQDAV